MTNVKTTKRALLSSAIALLVCFSMLVGTTFAWFTDSASSVGNIIQSGTLDVTMEWKDATANGAQQSWKDASEGAIFNYDKWEPGYVEAKNVRIGNAGTLALKYQFSIVPTGDATELTDAIDVYYAEGEFTIADRAMTELTYIGTLTSVLSGMSATAGGDLLAGESDTVTIALKMNENAGNQYQNLSIGSDFAVKVMATQLTSESDSFGDQYDKLATIDTEAELLEALAADFDLITLGSNIAMTATLEIPADKTVAIDLAGYTMSQQNVQTTQYAMIYNKGDLTIEDSVGTGKISYADITAYTADPGWASNTIRNEGVLTVNGGTIENVTAEEVMNFGYPHAIDAYQGSVTNINGGTVKSLNYDSIRMFCNSTTEATTVNINGGTVINRVSFQNPGSNTAGYGRLNIAGGNFITTNGVSANVRLLNFSSDVTNMKAVVTGGSFDTGFKTQNYSSVAVNTEDWLTFTGVEPTYAASSVAELAEAFAEGGNVVLTKDVALPVSVSVASGKAVTLDLGGHVLSHTNTAAGASCAIDNKGELTIKNGTVTYEGVGDPSFGYGTNTINNTGKLVIDGATVVNTTNSGSSNAIDNAPGSELIVNSGVIESEKITIRLRDGSVGTINGGTITGARSIQIHLFQNVDADTKLTINGGTFNGEYALYSYAYGNVTFARTFIEITGGTFNGIVGFGGGNKTATETVSITGGIFNDYLGRYLANNGWEDIAKP